MDMASVRPGIDERNAFSASGNTPTLHEETFRGTEAGRISPSDLKNALLLLHDTDAAATTTTSSTTTALSTMTTTTTTTTTASASAAAPEVRAPLGMTVHEVAVAHAGSAIEVRGWVHPSIQLVLGGSPHQLHASWPGTFVRNCYAFRIVLSEPDDRCYEDALARNALSDVLVGVLPSINASVHYALRAGKRLPGVPGILACRPLERILEAELRIGAGAGAEGRLVALWRNDPAALRDAELRGPVRERTRPDPRAAHVVNVTRSATSDERYLALSRFFAPALVAARTKRMRSKDLAHLTRLPLLYAFYSPNIGLLREETLIEDLAELGIDGERGAIALRARREYAWLCARHEQGLVTRAHTLSSGTLSLLQNFGLVRASSIGGGSGVNGGILDLAVGATLRSAVEQTFERLRRLRAGRRAQRMLPDAALASLVATRAALGTVSATASATASATVISEALECADILGIAEAFLAADGFALIGIDGPYGVSCACTMLMRHFERSPETYLVVPANEWSAMCVRLAPLRSEIVVRQRTLVLLDAHAWSARAFLEAASLLADGKHSNIDSILLVFSESVAASAGVVLGRAAGSADIYPRLRRSAAAASTTSAVLSPASLLGIVADGIPSEGAAAAAATVPSRAIGDAEADVEIDAEANAHTEADASVEARVEGDDADEGAGVGADEDEAALNSSFNAGNKSEASSASASATATSTAAASRAPAQAAKRRRSSAAASMTAAAALVPIVPLLVGTALAETFAPAPVPPIIALSAQLFVEPSGAAAVIPSVPASKRAFARGLLCVVEIQSVSAAVVAATTATTATTTTTTSAAAAPPIADDTPVQPHVIAAEAALAKLVQCMQLRRAVPSSLVSAELCSYSETLRNYVHSPFVIRDPSSAGALVHDLININERALAAAEAAKRGNAAPAFDLAQTSLPVSPARALSMSGDIRLWRAGHVGADENAMVSGGGNSDSDDYDSEDDMIDAAVRVGDALQYSLEHTRSLYYGAVPRDYEHRFRAAWSTPVAKPPHALLFQCFGARKHVRVALACTLDALARPEAWRQRKYRCPWRGDLIALPRVLSLASLHDRHVVRRLDNSSFTLSEAELERSIVGARPRDMRSAAAASVGGAPRLAETLGSMARGCCDVVSPSHYGGPPVTTAILRLDVGTTTPEDVVRLVAHARRQVVLLATNQEWAQWCLRHGFADEAVP